VLSRVLQPIEHEPSDPLSEDKQPSIDDPVAQKLAPVVGPEHAERWKEQESRAGMSIRT
jgi:hypothetical protein